MLTNTRVAWFNGTIMPEGQIMIPYRDRSWKSGDGAFDMTRTFNGAIFRLKEHIDRFYRSLRYVQIDPGLSPQEMIAVSQEVVARNEHLRTPHGDWWVCQRVSRGVDAVGDEGWEHTGPNVVVDVTPLPLASRATQYRDGAEVMTTTMRRTAPSMLSPRAKMNNYLNMIVAGQPIKAARPNAWPLLLDENGNLAEGSGSNIFIVQDEALRTPRERYVLPGVSRQMTMDLAAELGIPCTEADIDLFDAANADENVPDRHQFMHPAGKLLQWGTGWCASLDWRRTGNATPDPRLRGRGRVRLCPTAPGPHSDLTSPQAPLSPTRRGTSRRPPDPRSTEAVPMERGASCRVL